MDFSRLKCQLNWKKIDTASYVKIFQVSADEGMGINRVNFLSFQLKNFFKFMLALLVLVTSYCIIVSSDMCVSDWTSYADTASCKPCP